MYTTFIQILAYVHGNSVKYSALVAVYMLLRMKYLHVNVKGKFEKLHV